MRKTLLDFGLQNHALLFTAFNFLIVGKGGFNRIDSHFCVDTLLFAVIQAVSVLFCSMLKSLGVLRLWLEQDVCIRKLCLGGRISAEGAAGQVAVRRIVHTRGELVDLHTGY